MKFISVELSRIVGFAASVMLSGAALSQVYPSKPISIVVGVSPGGGTDILARLVAQKLADSLGQPALVENRAGASGSIAVSRVSKSPPDGHTLLVMPSSGAVLPALSINKPYDLLRDLAPVSLLSNAPIVLIANNSIRNVADLVSQARSQPGKLTFGSNGVGSSLFFAGELFKLLAKVDMLHVPYKGASESAVATATGEVTVSYTSLATALPLVKGGKVRPLAVTSGKRSKLAPDIPTLDEEGLRSYHFVVWMGLLAPPATPNAIITRLNTTLDKVLNTEEVRDTFYKQALEPQTSSPEEFAAFLRRELAQYTELVKTTGIKLE